MLDREHDSKAGDIVLLKFWIGVFVAAPTLGWIAQWLPGPLSRQTAIAIIIGTPAIVFTIAMLLSPSEDRDIASALCMIVLIGLFEVVWAALVALGVLLHRRMRTR